MMRASRERTRRPIENHTTAAWSNVKVRKHISNVAEPSIIQAINAKEYADDNEK